MIGDKLNFMKVFIAFLVIVFLTYWGSWNGFFEQDEWAGLGTHFAMSGLAPKDLTVALYSPLFQGGIKHFLILVPAANYILYEIFGLHYGAYVFTSLILHLLSTVLVYKICKKINLNEIGSLIAASLFAISATSSQAVTWVGTFLPTELAALLSVLAVYISLIYLDTKKIKYLIPLFILLLCAISFKETATFLFIFIPLLMIIKGNSQNRPALFFLLFLGFCYLLFRVTLNSINLGVGGALNQYLHIFLNLSSSSKIVIKGLAQIFTPLEALVSVGNILGTISGGNLGDPRYVVLLEKFMGEYALYAIGVVILIVIFLLLLKSHLNERKVILFSLLWILTSFLPLLFIPIGELNNSFLSPRGLYIPMIGGSMLIGLFVQMLIKNRSFLIVLIVLLFAVNLTSLRYQIASKVESGSERAKILSKIKVEYPVLPKKVVFYTESDRSFYGLPEKEKILPFQSGLGQTLMVWYCGEERLPKEFFKNKFLWEITDQGYKEIEGRGFGYFRDFNLLKESVRQNNLSIDDVIAFQYESQSNKLLDITSNIRNRLQER